MRELERRLDLVGLGLPAAAAIWVIIAGLITGGRPAPLATLLFTCGATAVATRKAARGPIVIILALVAAAPGVVAVLARQPLLGAGPLGYANASGALFFIAAGAAFMVGRLAHRTPVRTGAYLVATLWILIPWSSGALAAALLGASLPLSVVLLRRPTSARAALLAGAGLAVTALLATAALGHGYEPGERVGLIDRVVDATLTERRVALWSDAVDVLRAEPLTGVGPGRFRTLSATALGDRDARWAHNEYLEVAAETGALGLMLLVGLVLWGFAFLWDAAADLRTIPVVVVLGGAALHANIDYVWHFPLVPLTLAVLVGAGAAIRDTLRPPLQ